MEESNEYTNGICLIISLLQDCYLDKNIGEYERHYIGENNKFIVELTNNKTFQIHRHTAQDAESNNLSNMGESLGCKIKTYSLAKRADGYACG